MADSSLRLSDAHPEDRARFLWQVFKECEEYKSTKQDRILEVFRFVRNTPDRTTAYQSNFRHPYAYAAAEAIKGSTYPILFSGDPVFELNDPNPDNHERNQTTERLLSALIKNPLLTNFATAWDRILDDVIWFGFSFPWNYFRSQTRMVGPFYMPEMDESTGQPMLDTKGRLKMVPNPKPVRNYHAPWLEHIDVWDAFPHPDGIRMFVRRDCTGYDLLRQSRGANPMYDPLLIRRMIAAEGGRLKNRKSANYHDGTNSMRERDELAKEAGAEPGRFDQILRSEWAMDVLAKPYVIVHYDDGQQSGSYAAASDGSGFMELRWHPYSHYDGTPSWLRFGYGQSPQDLFPTGVLEIALPLLRLHSRFFQSAADIVALTQNPMWLVSRQFKDLNPQIISGPGSLVETPPVGAGGMDAHIKRLDMPAGAWQPMQFVDTIQVGLDSLLGQGDPQRGNFAGGRKTAREIAQVAHGAANRASVLHDRAANQFAIPLARKWLAMVAQHFTGRDYARVLGSAQMGYIPPSTDEIVSGLHYIPKGSVTGADQELRRAQWPGTIQALLQSLPYMQVPHIREAVKRFVTDMGFDAVSKMIPAEGDPRMTEYQQRIQMAVQSAQPGGVGGSPPRSPGDISGLLRQQGGASAPPPPVATGQGNGQQTQAARF